uniref:Uncharacterized protein n=1 Tax=Ascaris lumbricoides TaxID=6252 RepID=A0A0M3HU42_ASCLU
MQQKLRLQSNLFPHLLPPAIAWQVISARKCYHRS